MKYSVVITNCGEQEFLIFRVTFNDPKSVVQALEVPAPARRKIVEYCNLRGLGFEKASDQMRSDESAASSYEIASRSCLNHESSKISVRIRRRKSLVPATELLIR